MHPFSFTTTTTWRNTRAGANGGGIAIDAGGLNWASGITSTMNGTDELTIGTDPAAMLAFVVGLAGSPGRNISAASAVTVGGINGQRIELTLDETAGSVAWIIPGPDQFLVSPGSKSRIYILDTPGGATVLYLEAVKQADFESIVATTDPVIQSIVWQ